MSKKKYIYGFDLSLKSTGYAIYDPEEKVFVKIGHIDTMNMKPKLGRELVAMKMEAIYNKMYDLRDEYEPLIATFEAPIIFAQGGKIRNATSTGDVYMVHGVAKIVFGDVLLEYYAPKTLKAEIYHGNASKTELKKIIIERFPYLEAMFCDYNVLKPTKKLINHSEDESDAVLAVLTYLIGTNELEWVKPDRPVVKAEVIDLDIEKPKKVRRTRKK